MITNTFRKPLKSTYLWLLLGVLCSIGLLVIYLQTQATKVQREAQQAANLASLRLSAASSDDSDSEEITPFSPPSAADIQARFDQHLNALAFGQKIVGSFSYIQTDFREYGFNVLAPGYDEYQYPAVQLKTTLAHFKDGSSLSPKTKDSDDATIVDANKRIVAVDLSATYTLPGAAKRLTFNENAKARQTG